MNIVFTANNSDIPVNSLAFNVLLDIIDILKLLSSQKCFNHEVLHFDVVRHDRRCRLGARGSSYVPSLADIRSCGIQGITSWSSDWIGNLCIAPPFNCQKCISFLPL